MKLKNAVIGLQVCIKNGEHRKSGPYWHGKVGIIVETDRVNSGIGAYELMVQFSSDSFDILNACDVRKATSDDTGFV